MKRLLTGLRSVWVTRGLLVAAVALAGWALVVEREEAGAALHRVEPLGVTVAALAAVGTVIVSALAWRAVLADLGDRLSLRAAGTIFLLGQLGKYLPGSVWPVVMQAELGSRYAVPRRRTAAASVITLLVSLTSGLVMILLTLPWVGSAPGQVRWTGMLAVPLIAVLHPAVLGRILDTGLRVARREPLAARTTVRGTLVATAWTMTGWLLSGVQILALAVPLGMTLTPRNVALAVGGYTVAWLAGFLVVIAPAGAGAREATLILMLATAVPAGAALVVALLSRLLFSLADLGLAAVIAVPARRARG